MTERISTLNVYQGYSEPVADGYQRSSVHVAMEDGCRVAVDILRPTASGDPLDGPLPTVMLATGYRRAYRKGEQSFNAIKYAKLTAHLPVGTLITAYEQRPMCATLVQHGYNVVCMDLRGTGASFGPDAAGHWRNAADVAQTVDWIAAQPWATAKVGMIGGSWEGVIQLMTAVYQPRHLTCIVPQLPPSISNAIFDGGLALTGFARDWSEMRVGQDQTEQAEPVDGPDGAALFEQALEQRSAVYAAGDEENSFLAGADPNSGTRDVSEAQYNEGAPPAPFPELGPLRDAFDEFERVNRSGVAVYLQTGWWDMTFAGDCLDLYGTLSVPKRILVGPWLHGVLPLTEPLRWYDFWLKGIDNGIADEAPVVLATSDPDANVVWKGSREWPLPEVETRPLHLASGPSGTISSRLDGTLTGKTPATSSHDYTVDYGVGMGDCGRMRFMFRDVVLRHPNLIERGERCMTFTGPPLDEHLEITGSPAVFLELATTAADGAVHATLEQVLPDGRVAYLTEGWLNLEHRKIGRSPLAHPGPAWHSQRSEDMLAVVPGESMEVAFELYPISSLVCRGSRLRLTVAGTDKDNLHVPEHDPPPVLTLTVGGTVLSRLELPIERPPDRPAERIIEGAFAGQDPGFAFEVDGGPEMEE